MPAPPYVHVVTLGEGGMGQIDLVARGEGGFVRLFARKRLHGRYFEEDSFRSMFADEARIAALLHHANVVACHDAGIDEEGPYLVLDYVEGISLGDLMRVQRAAGQEIPVQFCVAVLRDAAEGLHAAHELADGAGNPLGLVHRDVSPGNILIGLDGTARVTDFGIAKITGSRTRTTTGLLKGKVGYWAPEQLRFEPIDRRADIFALGVCLYEMLTLERAFPGDDASEVARSLLHDPVPEPGLVRSDLPPELVALYFQMTAKDRGLRPDTAREVASALADIEQSLRQVQAPLRPAAYVAAHVDAESLRARRAMAEDVLARSSKPARAKKRIALALAAVALVAGAALASSMLWPDGERSAQVDAASPSVPEPIDRSELEASTPEAAHVDTPAEAVAPPHANAGPPRARPSKRTTRARESEPPPAAMRSIRDAFRRY